MFKSLKIVPDEKYPEADANIYTNPIRVDTFVQNATLDDTTMVDPIEDAPEPAQQIGNKKDIIGSIKKPPFFKNTTQNDMNLSLFKNTCLENLNIAESELGMLMFEKNKLTNKVFKSRLNLYCNLRNSMNAYKDFEYIFPNIYITTLSYAFNNINEENSQFINNVMNLIKKSDFYELSILELSLEQHPGSAILNKKNTKLFSQQPSRITKRGGRTTKKYKKKFRKSRKYYKHKKI